MPHPDMVALNAAATTTTSTLSTIMPQTAVC